MSELEFDNAFMALSEEEKVEVLKTKTDEEKRKALKLLDSDRNRAVVVDTMSDDVKLEVLQENPDIIKSINIKFILVNRMNNDEVKLQALSFLSKEDQSWTKKVIEEMESEKIKEKALDLLEDRNDRLSIIGTMSYEKKVEYIQQMSLYDSEIVFLIKTMSDDEKIKSLHLVSNKIWDLSNPRYEIVQTMSLEKQCEVLLIYPSMFENEIDRYRLIGEILSLNRVLNKLNIDDEIKLLGSINDEERLAIALDDASQKLKFAVISKESPVIIGEENKARIIKKMKKDKDKIDALAFLETKEAKKNVILSLGENPEYIKEIIEDKEKREEIGLDSYCLSKLIIVTHDPDYIKSIIEDKEKRETLGMENSYIVEFIEFIKEQYTDEKKIELLKLLCENEKLEISITNEILSLIDIKIIEEHVEEVLRIKGIPEEKWELVKKLSKTNELAIINVDGRLLDENYLNTLGENKVNLIICYPEIQDKVLSLNDKEFNIFYRCLNNFMKTQETDEWTVLAYNILYNIGGYRELIGTIEDYDNLDVVKVSSIIQDSNNFGIQTPKELENYTQIKEERCNSVINNPESNIGDLQDVVFQKIFGHSKNYAELLIKKYGEDSEKLKDEDVKLRMRVIKRLMETSNPEILREIYNGIIEETIEIADKIALERTYKNEYCKLFNEGLLTVDGLTEIEGEENVFDAGTDFKMIITSLGAFSYDGIEAEDFRKSWNVNKIDTQHFCASYIRNDMLGTAPIHSICYGFTELKEDSLMLSGPKDVYSSRRSFVSIAMHSEIYYSPENQINNTERYNEMDFRRFQNGEKKPPSYIVVFKENGVIQNLDIAKKASKDWRRFANCSSRQGKMFRK